MDNNVEMENLTPSCNQNWRHFNDGTTLVDFVLVYRDYPNGNDKRKSHEKRSTFQASLIQAGLILEEDRAQKLNFVKIHVPHTILYQYSEFLKIRVPLKDEFQDDYYMKSNQCLKWYHRLMFPKKFPPKTYKLNAVFSKDKQYLFDMTNPDLFSNSTRIKIVWYLLGRASFGKDDQDKGIKRLISENVYKTAYPLHNSDLHKRDSKRRLLLTEWAVISKFLKFQPLDQIKEYFGIKIALYFTWLGFYTQMLIPMACAGLISVIYAMTTLTDNKFVQDVCAANVTMCPRCSKHCDYWQLNEGCMYAQIQHHIDNTGTVFFAIFMSLWSTLYLELWKRYSAGIGHRWGLTDYDLQAEPPRPEYLMRLTHQKKMKLNTVTKLHEPAVAFWRMKVPSLVLSFTVVVLWTVLSLAIVCGVIIYRMSIVTTQFLFSDSTTYVNYVIPITAALLNLVCILGLNWIYNRLAYWLTELELQRTQTEFDDSMALKIYMFQFINYYSSIFYVAFFKGKFVGYPAKYNYILGFRQEECNPGGCLMELTIQLATIMIGSQAINAILEMLVPHLRKLYNSIKVSSGIQKARPDEDVVLICNQWTEDYKLCEFNSQNLFTEYLEMVLQYGFVTIFVAAFPLAPLFALINNVFEMRLDAKKMIKYYRRPIPQRVKDIGVWLPIMTIIGRISVVSNAFIVAFSSNFIVRLVYRLHVATRDVAFEGDDSGLLDFTLAYFNTSDFSVGTAPLNPSVNTSICRYQEFRNSPDHGADKYKRPLIFWHVLAARLAFVVIYQNVVNFVITAVEALIPDASKKLKRQIKREAYKTNEIIIKYETERQRAFHTI